ncbi:MAG: GntR family transcriptional regulator [Pseudomonadota bacterium]
MDSRSRKARCLEALRHRILTLDLPPGSALDEATLAAEYEISRPPLRESLRQLAGEGYVAIRENRGATVAPMDQRTLRNFFLTAPMIYSAVARLAADHATPAQIMRLKDTQILFRAAIREGDTARRAILNERFHALMGDMAANEFLAPSLRRLLIDHTRISMTFYDPRFAQLAKQRERAADQHDRFIELIEVRDGQGAADLALAHWELSRSEIESFVTPEALNIQLGSDPKAAHRTGTI